MNLGEVVEVVEVEPVYTPAEDAPAEPAREAPAEPERVGETVPA